MKEIKKCKWCDNEILNKRIDAIFCRRACKAMFRRALKNKLMKNDKVLQ